jgi:hypothetical protein
MRSFSSALLGQPGPTIELALGPPTPEPKRPKDAADPDIVHARRSSREALISG